MFDEDFVQALSTEIAQQVKKELRRETAPKRLMTLPETAPISDEASEPSSSSSSEEHCRLPKSTGSARSTGLRWIGSSTITRTGRLDICLR